MVVTSLYGSRVKGVTISDFGPMKKGKIELRPLTIFVGTNNSGKSYAATLVYALNKAFTPTIYYPHFRELYFFSPFEIPVGKVIVQSIFDSAEKLDFTISDKRQEIRIEAETVHKARTQELKSIEKRVNDLIAREFGSTLRDLKNDGKNLFTIGVHTDRGNFNAEYRRNKIFLTESEQWTRDIVFRFVNDDSKLSKRILLESIEPEETAESIIVTVKYPFVRLTVSESESVMKKRDIDEILYDILARPIYKLLGLGNISGRHHAQEDFYYLPAARSGILQGHTALAAAWIRLIPSTAGVSDMKIDRFSGVVADFLSNIIDFPREKKPLFDVAEKFEKEIIKGHIVLTPQPETRNLAIEYDFGKMKIPINRSSSTVSELAPIFLFLKYTLSKDDTIIIEEPEAHLHVANQRILARLIVSMIRNGLKVLITTHSETLLEEISYLIVLQNLPNRIKVEEKLGTELYLDKDEVSVFNFSFNDQLQGTVIEALHVDSLDGIPQDEFMKVHEELYDDSTKARYLVEKAKGVSS